MYLKYGGDVDDNGGYQSGLQFFQARKIRAYNEKKVD